MKCFERTIGCGLISEELLDKEIVLVGWVNKRRDHGGLIFIDLRDRTGIMQIVFNPKISEETHKMAHNLRSEFVISVSGKVVLRDAQTINPDIPTGKFELQAEELTILNKSQTLPFSLDETIDEELRFKYRYLDLRRPEMLNNIAMRHKLIFAIREFMDKEGFYEVETPILTKNTAEGAREFLVPSRFYKGSFFALPQSPQLYKELLMAGGIEKYFQIAKCFRDEDLRADRQPEFTQFDMEMSFVNEPDVQSITERLLKYVFKKIFNIDLEIPLPRMNFDDAFNLYGSDKPDLRCELVINDLTKLFLDAEISFIQNVIKNGGKVGALHIKQHQFTRSELDYWVNQMMKDGAKGLLWIRYSKEKVLESPVAKFLPEDFFERVKSILPAFNYADTLFLVVDKYKTAWTHLGRLRLQLAEKLNLFDECIKLLWVTDFPLFEYDEEKKEWQSVLHPFTAPQVGWESLEKSKMKSRGYDIIFNGVELGGGSIRIHDANLQKKIFELLGFGKDEIEHQFGFLLKAMQLGFPPLGGIALGIDRLLMILLNCKSIREVIAFPKTQSGYDPLMDAPTKISDKKLKDYGLKLLKDENKN